MEIKRSDKMNNWSFGIDNDKLIGLVLEGKKTATSSLYNFDKIPVIEEESIIHFDNEKDACIVETVDYKIIKYNEMTEELAKLEGEGDLSLNYWKQVHLNFFKSVNPNFKEDDKIIFEIFKVTKNLVEERLKLGKSIASKNTDLLGNIVKVEEINSGFNNTLFNINDKYVIKVCTNKELENTFENEKDFYLSNKDNCFIPKLYKYDDSKVDCDYIYEVIEKIKGKTLYYYWYKMNEADREKTIEKLIDIIKKFHSVNGKEYDWKNKIKGEIKNRIIKCKKYFKIKDYNMILESIDKYDEYLSDNKFALIHNDLHFDNVIYNNGKLTIIDFNDSIQAPIDFEFRLLYMCQEQPWKWADIEMDPYQKPEDYKNIWNYIKKYYKELNEIKFLEQRMIIYRIWNDIGHLKKYHNVELTKGIVENSKKLI